MNKVVIELGLTRHLPFISTYVERSTYKKYFIQNKYMWMLLTEYIDNTIESAYHSKMIQIHQPFLQYMVITL